MLFPMGSKTMETVSEMNSERKNSKRLKVDGTNFESEVLNSKLPVLVAFATPWSRACKIIESVLDEIASSYAGKLRVAQVNADEDPDLGLWYEIQAVPTLLYFVEGNVRCRVVGTATTAAILSRLESVSNAGAGTRRNVDA